MIDRIRIIGIPGTGKTTFAKKLAKILRCKHYELDDIFWKRKFDIKRPDPERIKLLNKLATKNRWVIEGGSSSWAKPSFTNADIILYLHVPFYVIAYRVMKRHLHRRFFTNNRYIENLKDAIELIRYSHYKHTLPATHKKSYKRILKPYKYKVIHLHSRKQIEHFLRNFKQQSL